MRQSCFAVLLSAIALTIGCRHAPNGSSALAPAGTISNQMTPARSVSTGIGPFGGRTRIAPPGTGSYAVPNNYMGGAPPVGEFGANTAPVDSFDRASGVRPAAFAETATNRTAGTFGAGFDNPSPANMNAAPGMTPQLGGMRVHDLTNTPPPPGYQPHGIIANQGSFQSQPTFTPQGAPAQQFFNGNAPVTNQYPANNFAPQPTQRNSTQPNLIQPNNSQPRMPNFLPGAQIAGSPQAMGQPSFSTAQLPGNTSGEVPLRPSPMQPSFRGAAQFPSTAPSTDPVNNNAPGQSPDLPWRRPTSAY